MLDIVLISVGKMKEGYYCEASNEYLKRLSTYAKIKIEELPAEAFRSESDKKKSKKAEGDRLQSVLKKYSEAEIFILDENGLELTSHKFANKLSEGERKKLVFVIGGTLGLSDDILEKHENKLSLSKMTLPHELVKVVLLEQMYRGACINSGKQYHY